LPFLGEAFVATRDIIVSEPILTTPAPEIYQPAPVTAAPSIYQPVVYFTEKPAVAEPVVFFTQKPAVADPVVFFTNQPAVFSVGQAVTASPISTFNEQMVVSFLPVLLSQENLYTKF
jgi:hypothetical protein